MHASLLINEEPTSRKPDEIHHGMIVGLGKFIRYGKNKLSIHGFDKIQIIIALTKSLDDYEAEILSVGTETVFTLFDAGCANSDICMKIAPI